MKECKVSTDLPEESEDENVRNTLTLCIVEGVSSGRVKNQKMAELAVKILVGDLRVYPTEYVLFAIREHRKISAWFPALSDLLRFIRPKVDADEAIRVAAKAVRDAQAWEEYLNEQKRTTWQNRIESVLPSWTAGHWRREIVEQIARGGWLAQWGPEPGEEGCLAPPEIIDELDELSQRSAKYRNVTTYNVSQASKDWEKRNARRKSESDGSAGQ